MPARHPKARVGTRSKTARKLAAKRAKKGTMKRTKQTRKMRSQTMAQAQTTAAEIIAGTHEGIYVNFGSVFPNPVTGEISATVDFGYKIEQGKLAYPLKNTMLGINIFDLLNNLDAVSSDYREEPGMILPTIRVQNVKVAGAE